MAVVSFVRENQTLRITVRETQTSKRGLIKIIGDSQVAQLLDLANALLPENEDTPEAEERNFVDNDEYDFIFVSEGVYRLILKVSKTTFEQFDFSLDELEEFIEQLTPVRDEVAGDLEIGPPVLTLLEGPQGPAGPQGPQGTQGPTGP